MPEGTRVDNCFEKLKSEGHSEASAAAICQSSTKQNLHTGQPIKHAAKEQSLMERLAAMFPQNEEEKPEQLVGYAEPEKLAGRTEDHESFHHAIAARPGDPTPKLVYADWLEEHRHQALADLIRRGVEGAGSIGENPSRRPDGGHNQVAFHGDLWSPPGNPDINVSLNATEGHGPYAAIHLRGSYPDDGSRSHSVITSYNTTDMDFLKRLIQEEGLHEGSGTNLGEFLKRRRRYEEGKTDALGGDRYDHYAWPGGYPMYYLTADNGVLCPECANENADLTQGDPSDRQWHIVANDVNYEDPHLHCDHCNKRIESAYAEDEAEPQSDEEPPEAPQPLSRLVDAVRSLQLCRSRQSIRLAADDVVAAAPLRSGLRELPFGGGLMHKANTTPGLDAPQPMPTSSQALKSLQGHTPPKPAGRISRGPFTGTMDERSEGDGPRYRMTTPAGHLSGKETAALAEGQAIRKALVNLSAPIGHQLYGPEVAQRYTEAAANLLRTQPDHPAAQRYMQATADPHRLNLDEVDQAALGLVRAAREKNPWLSIYDELAKQHARKSAPGPLPPKPIDLADASTQEPLELHEPFQQPTIQPAQDLPPIKPARLPGEMKRGSAVGPGSRLGLLEDLHAKNASREQMVEALARQFLLTPQQAQRAVRGFIARKAAQRLSRGFESIKLWRSA